MRITDRSKDVIKSGGEWISSIELENLAVGHPGVAEAAVIGVKHPKWDERPLLIVVAKKEGAPSREELLDFLRPKVAKWWMPDDVVFVDEIPHTATGKIQKTALARDLSRLSLADAPERGGYGFALITGSRRCAEASPSGGRGPPHGRGSSARLPFPCSSSMRSAGGRASFPMRLCCRSSDRASRSPASLSCWRPMRSSTSGGPGAEGGGRGGGGIFYAAAGARAARRRRGGSRDLSAAQRRHHRPRRSAGSARAAAHLLGRRTSSSRRSLSRSRAAPLRAADRRGLCGGPQAGEDRGWSVAEDVPPPSAAKPAPPQAPAQRGPGRRGGRRS